MQLKTARWFCFVIVLVAFMIIGGCSRGPEEIASGTGSKNQKLLEQVLSNARNLTGVHFEGQLQVGTEVTANYNGAIQLVEGKQYLYSMELLNGKEASHNNLKIEIFIDKDTVYLQDPFSRKWKSSQSESSVEKMANELKMQAKINEPLYLIKGVMETTADQGKLIEEKQISGHPVEIYELKADIDDALSKTPYQINLGEVDPTTIKEIKYRLAIGKEDRNLYMYTIEQLINSPEQGEIKVINSMTFNRHNNLQIVLPKELQELIQEEKKNK